MTSLLNQLVATAEELVYLTTELPSNLAPERSGGVLTLGFDNLSYRKIIPIGTVEDSNKLYDYTRFSEEKAVRLYSDWLRDPENTVSSWQTRNGYYKQYGGAVLFPNDSKNESIDIISFSGFKEEFDEAVSLMLGNELGILSQAHLTKVLDVSDDYDAYSELQSAYRRLKSLGS